MSSTQYSTPRWQIVANGMNVPLAVGDDVLSVTVTLEQDSLDRFSLVLANTEDAYTHGQYRELFKPGTEVTIGFGFQSSLETVFEGEVTGLAADFQTEAPTTVTVEGHSKLHRLRGATKTKTYLNLTDGQIVAQLAKAAGLSAAVDATNTRHQYVLQANQTDFDFLLDRARRIGFELRSEGKKLLFRKARYGKPKSLTLVWGDVGGTSRHPLTRFRPTLDTTLPVTQVLVKALHVDSRRAVVGKAQGTPSTDGGKPAASVVKSAFGARETAVVDTPVASQAEADALAKALFEEHTHRLVTGNGTCIGLPALRPGVVVEIEGLGRTFSGAYLVTRATHRFDDADGYQTTFDVRRGEIG
jgi:phage protein D